MILEKRQPSAEILPEILDRVIDEAERDSRASFAALVRAAGLDPARDFIGTYLADLDFRDEDLRGFDFSYADLTGADFRRANVSGVRFDGAILTGAIGLNKAHRAFKMEPPQRKNWSWCAVAVSVANYYDPAAAWKQCELANLVLGRSDCCRSDGSSECDRHASLSDALKITGNLISSTVGLPTEEDIMYRIRHGEVIPCLVEYLSSRVIHPIVITDGYKVTQEGKLLLTVSDPLSPEVEIIIPYGSNIYKHVGIVWARSYRAGTNAVSRPKAERQDLTSVAMTTMSTKVAVILTAIQAETEAVLRHLVDRDRQRVADTWFQTGRFGSWRVAIAEVGLGNARASTVAVRALTHFLPEIAAFVGVSGGVKDVVLGDVVVATKVYSYEAGKDTVAGFLARPDVQNSDHELEQRARLLRTSINWHNRLNASLWPDAKPSVHVGPIAAGEAVVASRKSRIGGFLKKHYSDALAVEMEGRGFLEAAHIDSGCRAVVIRGISDLLTGKTQADKLGWQRRAADAAAAFFFEMLALETIQSSPEKTTEPLLRPGIGKTPEVVSVMQRIRKFREERLAKIAAGAFPSNIKVHDGSKMVLHVIPYEAISQDRSINVERVFTEERLYLPPLGVTGYNGPIVNLYGAVTTHARVGDPTTAYAYLFRSGIIEGVYRFGVDEQGNSFIVAPPFEQQVLNTLKEYLLACKKLQLHLPIYVFLSFCNTKGCRLRDVREGIGFYQSDGFSEEIIAPNEVIIDDYDAEFSGKMSHLFTLIWNAFSCYRG
jgi:nucleoside phosphorylase